MYLNEFLLRSNRFIVINLLLKCEEGKIMSAASIGVVLGAISGRKLVVNVNGDYNGRAQAEGVAQNQTCKWKLTKY